MIEKVKPHNIVHGEIFLHTFEIEEKGSSYWYQSSVDEIQ